MGDQFLMQGLNTGRSYAEMLQGRKKDEKKRQKLSESAKVKRKEKVLDLN